MSHAAARILPIVALLAVGSMAACDDPAALAPGDLVRAEIAGLAALDPATEGVYELWIYDDAGQPHSAGRVPPDAAFDPLVMDLEVPAEGAARVALTVEPPGDQDPGPSRYRIMAGSFRDGVAALEIEGSLTDGRPFVEEPGHHSLFTSSNNVAEGYPSSENSGIWLFSIYLDRNVHGAREVHLTPLEPAWMYEGWIVRRFGTDEEVWISYGKYRPDLYGLLTSRDNTGSGPFSGDEDFRNGGVEDVPGEEWTTNIFDLEIPGGLSVPFALDSLDQNGAAVWHHVITVEPAFDEMEPLTTERPFPIRPYSNPIGAGRPGDPRRILYQGGDPHGTAAVVR